MIPRSEIEAMIKLLRISEGVVLTARGQRYGLGHDVIEMLAEGLELLASKSDSAADDKP